MSNDNGRTIGRASVPERNNYFYGKLLDETALKKEQDYFRHRSALINRILVGFGVACGLRLDESAEGSITISPGVAIDRYGREIVVVEPMDLNPRLLTDESGEPTGEEASDTEVEICLLYNEDKIDPVPVLVPKCGDEPQCAPCTVQEQFRVVVRETVESELVEFEGDITHEALCEWIAGIDPSADGDPCVCLGTVGLSSDGITVDMCKGRRILLSNDLLFKLILRLSER